MQNNVKICFIGGGNMAQALIGGLADKLTAAKNIHVVDINLQALNKLEQQFGVSTSLHPDTVLATADVWVLAVKPQQMHEVVASLLPFSKNQLVISIAAGIRAEDLSRWLSGHKMIVRAMPNTPALIGKGITGLVALSEVTEEQKQIANAIMQAVGETVWIEQEEQINAVTAVSGSGPAYVFYFLEAMQSAAIELGLSAEQGKQLALATFAGATELAAQSNQTLVQLRENVTSKGGTTYAALTSMQNNKVEQSIVQALHAAAKRGEELGVEFGKN
jgi:pyrroline-5-carboxylate reductase